MLYRKFRLFYLLPMLILTLSNNAIGATLTQYTNQATYNAALPASPHFSTLEDFTSVTTNTPMATTSPGDAWNGFSVSQIGTVAPFGNSGYCPSLNGPFNPIPPATIRCISYNLSAPALPGIVGSFGTAPERGVRFTPDPSNLIFGFSFDFVDWNDNSIRSEFRINLSDATSQIVSGPINPSNAPPQFFGFLLDEPSSLAGVHITSIEWYGVGSELVGFWNIGTKYRPRPATPVPTLSQWMLILLSLLLSMLGFYLRRNRSYKMN